MTEFFVQRDRTRLAMLNDPGVPALPNTPVHSSHSTRSASSQEELLVDLGSPKSRPVTPELLYSRVVTAYRNVECILRRDQA
jgi:hypothetical protein